MINQVWHDFIEFQIRQLYRKYQNSFLILGLVMTDNLIHRRSTHPHPLSILVFECIRLYFTSLPHSFYLETILILIWIFLVFKFFFVCFCFFHSKCWSMILTRGSQQRTPLFIGSSVMSPCQCPPYASEVICDGYFSSTGVWVHFLRVISHLFGNWSVLYYDFFISLF